MTAAAVLNAGVAWLQVGKVMVHLRDLRFEFQLPSSSLLTTVRAGAGLSKRVAATISFHAIA